MSKIFVKVLTFILIIFPFSAIARAENVLQLGGREYPILEQLAIEIIPNNFTGKAMSFVDKSPQPRYKLIKFLPILTQEVATAKPPAPRSLYRLVEVYDSQEHRTLQVAIPIEFKAEKN